MPLTSMHAQVECACSSCASVCMHTRVWVVVESLTGPMHAAGASAWPEAQSVNPRMGVLEP